MIYTTLPDPAAYAYPAPELSDNVLVFAETQAPYYYPKHQTPYMLVANFLSKGEYIVNQQQIEASDSCFYFLNRNDDLEVCFSGKRPLQTLFILFESKFMEGVYAYFEKSDTELLDVPMLPDEDRSLQLPKVPYSFSPVIKKRIYTLRQRADDKMLCEGLLFQIFEAFVPLNAYTLRQIDRIDARKRSTREELYKRLFTAREFINDRCCETLTIEQIARESQLNKFHFMVNFKSLFGITPHQYLTERRLEKARALLVNEHYRVTDACYHVGFTSIGSFSNAFKKRFGVAPSRIRADY